MKMNLDKIPENSSLFGLYCYLLRIRDSAAIKRG
jgi:hypothetical protein